MSITTILFLDPSARPRPPGCDIARFRRVRVVPVDTCLGVVGRSSGKLVAIMQKAGPMKDDPERATLLQTGTQQNTGVRPKREGGQSQLN
jgi:hypothetical protein